jgi:hypothetical protein
MKDGVIEFENGGRLKLTTMANEPRFLDDGNPPTFRHLHGVLTGNNVAADEKGVWVEHSDFREAAPTLDGGYLIKRYNECLSKLGTYFTNEPANSP